MWRSAAGEADTCYAVLRKRKRAVNGQQDLAGFDRPSDND